MSFEASGGYEAVSGRAKIILRHFMSEMVGVQRLNKTFKTFRLKLMTLQHRFKECKAVKDEQQQLLLRYFERERQRMVIMYLKMKEKAITDLVPILNSLQDKFRDRLLTVYFKACRSKYIKDYYEWRKQCKAMGKDTNEDEFLLRKSRKIWTFKEIDFDIRLP